MQEEARWKRVGFPRAFNRNNVGRGDNISAISLGTMIPKSGGDYAYINEAFGPLPAFLYLWAALLVIMPAGNAITSLTFASYILQPFWPECEPPVKAVRLLAASIICES